MKPFLLVLLTLIGGGVCHPARGQSLDKLSEAAPFLAAALSEFFSDTRSFTGNLDFQLTSEGRAEATRLPFTIAMNAGRMRLELNTASPKGGAAVPEALATLGELGLDHFVVLYTPAKPVILAIPSVKSFVEISIPKGDALHQKASEKVGHLAKQELGKESLAGHPTVKYAVRIPGDDGKATVWHSTTLENLPVRIQIAKGKETYAFQLRNVRFGPIDPRKFQMPTDFTLQKDVPSLLSAVALKSLGTAAGLDK